MLVLLLGVGCAGRQPKPIVVSSAPGTAYALGYPAQLEAEADVLVADKKQTNELLNQLRAGRQLKPGADQAVVLAIVAQADEAGRGAEFAAANAQMKAGKLRALACFSPQRAASTPDVPTLKELGYNVEFSIWVGLFAPKGTPEPVLKRLSDAAGQVAALPEIKEKLLMVAQNVDHQPYDKYAVQVRDDQAYFAKLLKELDIKLE